VAPHPFELNVVVGLSVSMEGERKELKVTSFPPLFGRKLSFFDEQALVDFQGVHLLVEAFHSKICSSRPSEWIAPIMSAE
jgi:hypothetical protein